LHTTHVLEAPAVPPQNAGVVKTVSNTPYFPLPQIDATVIEPEEDVQVPSVAYDVE